MARRSRTILDDLALLPWWVNVILAALVYLSFKYVIPSISFQNPFLKGISGALPSFARIAGGILLCVAGISAFNAMRKGRLLDRQTGIIYIDVPPDDHDRILNALGLVYSCFAKSYPRDWWPQMKVRGVIDRFELKMHNWEGKTIRYQITLKNGRVFATEG